MIGKRTEALLQAAATIYAGVLSSARFRDDPRALQVCVEDAYALLAEIERREQANAPTSVPLTKCYGCGCSGPSNCVCPKER